MAVTASTMLIPVPAQQKPSIGCNIKWKPGAEPACAKQGDRWIRLVPLLTTTLLQVLG